MAWHGLAYTCRFGPGTPNRSRWRDDVTLERMMLSSSSSNSMRYVQKEMRLIQKTKRTCKHYTKRKTHRARESQVLLGSDISLNSFISTTTHTSSTRSMPPLFPGLLFLALALKQEQGKKVRQTREFCMGLKCITPRTEEEREKKKKRRKSKHMHPSLVFFFFCPSFSIHTYSSSVGTPLLIALHYKGG